MQLNEIEAEPVGTMHGLDETKLENRNIPLRELRRGGLIGEDANRRRRDGAPASFGGT